MPALVYVGINKHEGEDIGLYDTVLSAADHSVIFENGGNGATGRSGDEPGVMARRGR
jgi:hypothetical protein